MTGTLSVDQLRFNFGPGDNPAYQGIYDASALSTGATMTAVELLLSDEVDAAFSISGGLHHAMPSYAYGFCVFNDPVIGIKRLLAEGMRVAYVDIDCHHGDGVQHAFYDTDGVMTISLHESGAFLFPGTGHTQEIGAGRGRGYSVNVPLYPYTTDEVYLWAVREVAMPLLRRFRPDALVTQLGIDSHFKDPITHLALSVQGHAAVVEELGIARSGQVACSRRRRLRFAGGGAGMGVGLCGYVRAASVRKYTAGVQRKIRRFLAAGCGRHSRSDRHDQGCENLCRGERPVGAAARFWGARDAMTKGLRIS